MKMLICHFSSCKENKATCQWCKRIWLLLRLHAQRCVRDACDVMACRQLKERLRMLQQQQLQMDDRRRQAMNRHHDPEDDEPSESLTPVAQAHAQSSSDFGNESTAGSGASGGNSGGSGSSIGHGAGDRDIMQAEV
jgi:uncharacterized membrane protein YgcG